MTLLVDLISQQIAEGIALRAATNLLDTSVLPELRRHTANAGVVE